MIINVTDEQKKIIESQGYMVVEFKKWCMNIKPLIDRYVGLVVDTFNLIFTFLQEMAFKLSEFTERLLDLGIDILDKFKPDDELFVEESEKFPFIRSLETKYRPNIRNRVIYHRCRDRC